MCTINRVTMSQAQPRSFCNIESPHIDRVAESQRSSWAASCNIFEINGALGVSLGACFFILLGGLQVGAPPGLHGLTGDCATGAG